MLGRKGCRLFGITPSWLLSPWISDSFAISCKLLTLFLSVNFPQSAFWIGDPLFEFIFRRDVCGTLRWCIGILFDSGELWGSFHSLVCNGNLSERNAQVLEELFPSKNKVFQCIACVKKNKSRCYSPIDPLHARHMRRLCQAHHVGGQ